MKGHLQFQQALDVLSKDRRVTRTREVILRSIFELRQPFSAKELLKALPRRGGKPFDLVTLYRNLRIFEDSGIICRGDYSDEMARYMVSEPGHDHHHHHVVCRICRRVEAVDFCVLDGQERILEKMGFTQIKHRLEFSAVCRSCGKR